MIYILDDNELQLYMYKNLFAEYTDKLYVTFRKASDLLQAVECASPDVLICDVSMPDADGFEIARAVKEIAPETPTIIATCLPENVYRHKAEKLGYKFWNKQHLKHLEELING